MNKHFEGPLQVGYEFDETGYPLFVVAGLSGDQKRDRPTLDSTAKLFAAAPELLEALKELLESGLALMPPAEAGKEAQDAWADRRAAARNNASALITRVS